MLLGGIGKRIQCDCHVLAIVTSLLGIMVSTDPVFEALGRCDYQDRVAMRLLGKGNSIFSFLPFSKNVLQ